MVIDTRNEDIVVQAGGCAEDVSGIIQAVSSGRVVGHGLTGTEGPVEVTSMIDQVKHGRIDPDSTRIQVLELRGIKGGSPAAYVYIAKDALAERRGRNNALGALLLTLTGSLIVGEEKQPVLLKRPAHRNAKDIAI